MTTWLGRGLLAAGFVLLAQFFPARVTTPAGGGPGLITGPSDFAEVGQFRLPNPGGLGFAGLWTRTVGNVYNDPVYGPSLLIECSYINPGQFAQIQIPATINKGSIVGLGGLTTGTLRNGNCQDVTDGLASGGTPTSFTAGVLYDGGGLGDKLIWSSGTQYTGNLIKFGVTGMNFAASTSSGSYDVGTFTYPRMTGGHYMAPVPSAWQAALGGKILSGAGAASVVGEMSAGPAIFSLDADQLYNQPPAGTDLNFTQLAAWDTNHMQLGSIGRSSLENQSVNGIPVPRFPFFNPHDGLTYTVPWWNSSDSSSGLFFPDNTASVIVTGTKVLDVAECYGFPKSTNPPVPLVGQGEIDYTVGSGAFTTTPGTVVRFPAGTNTNAMVNRYFQLDGESTPNYYDAGGNHPGMTRGVSAAGSGGATPTLTVNAAYNTNVSPTTYAWASGEDCYNPDGTGGPGPQGYPAVRMFMMALDANDLAAVKAGTKLPYQVVPYGGWFMNAWNLTGTGGVSGGPYGAHSTSAIWEAATRRVYLVVSRANADPLIYVYQVATPAPAPAPTPTPAPLWPVPAATGLAVWSLGLLVPRRPRVIS